MVNQQIADERVEFRRGDINHRHSQVLAISGDDVAARIENRSPNVGICRLVERRTAFCRGRRDVAEIRSGIEGAENAVRGQAVAGCASFGAEEAASRSTSDIRATPAEPSCVHTYALAAPRAATASAVAVRMMVRGRNMLVAGRRASCRDPGRGRLPPVTQEPANLYREQ